MRNLGFSHDSDNISRVSITAPNTRKRKMDGTTECNNPDEISTDKVSNNSLHLNNSIYIKLKNVKQIKTAFCINLVTLFTWINFRSKLKMISSQIARVMVVLITHKQM